MNSTTATEEGRPRILAVDDDGTVRSILTRILSRQGYEVVPAATAGDALERAAEGTFELVVLDIMLPDGKGTEIIGPLRELQPDIEIILFTGHASLDSAMQAVREHVSAYITKPVCCDEILAAVRSGLEKRRLVLENRRLVEALQEELASRRRVDTRLREATVEQQVILDSVPAMVWYKDTENRILRVNRAAAEGAGLALEEIEGKTCEELFPDEAEGYYREDMAVIQSGEAKLGIIEKLQTAQGEKRWLRTDKIPHADENGQITGLVVFSVDITAQLHAEKAKRTAEANYQNLISSSPDAIVVVDRSGLVLFVNPAAVTLFGRRPEDLLHRTFGYPCIPGTRTEIDIVRPGRDAAAAEMHVTEVTWGEEICWLLSICDVTARVQAQEALQRSAERLQVLRDVDRGILGAQSLDALVEAVLHHVPRLVPCASRACAMRFDVEAGVATVIGVFETQKGRGPAAGEALPLPPSGELELFRQGQARSICLTGEAEHRPAFYAELARGGLRSGLTLPLRAEGELLGVLNVFADRPDGIAGEDLDMARELAEVLALSIHQVVLHEQVTSHAAELEKALFEIETMQKQLVAGERLRALGNMAGGVAHEFNNSLGPVVGFTDMLLKRPDMANDAVKRSQLLSHIYTAATDAVETVKRLREFYRSREREDTVEPVSVSDLIVPSSTPPGESQVGVSAFTVMGYVSGRVVRETLTLRLS
ncbi:MAG: PAS domain S-box protein [Lentisphaerae bacterium]|nr:PAS domain S-box protein [Lentisphaerota bacterium]